MCGCCGCDDCLKDGGTCDWLDGKDAEEFEAVEGKDRGCTDIVFVFIFMGVITILAYLGIQNGLDGGNPSFILKGWDSFGNICGEKNPNRTIHPNSGLDMTNNPHWYYARPDHGKVGLMLCLPKCPSLSDTGSIEGPASLGDDGKTNLEMILDKAKQIAFKAAVKIEAEGDAWMAKLDESTEFLDDNKAGEAIKDLLGGAFDGVKGAVSFYQDGVLHCAGSGEAQCRAAGGCLGAPYNMSQNMVDNDDLYPTGCPEFTYDSYAPMGFHCIPRFTEDPFDLTAEGQALMASYTNNTLSMKVIQAVLGDILTLSDQVTALMGGTIFLSFLLVVTAQCWGPCVIWTVWIGVILCTLFAMGFMSYAFYEDREAYYNTPLIERGEEDLDNMRMAGYMAAGCFVIGSFFLCLIVSMRKRIRSSVHIQKIASKANCDMPCIFVVPWLCSLMMMAWAAICVVVAVYIGTAAGETNPDTGYFRFIGDKLEGKTISLLIVLLATYWGWHFWSGVQDFIIASAMSRWYIADGKYDGSYISIGLKNAFRYHIGTIAFSSLIISIIQIIKMLLGILTSWFDDDDKDSKGTKGFLVKCCCCCLWCFEKLFKFASRNATIEVAIWGDNFLVASCRALTTLMSEVGLVAMLNGTSFLLAIIIKLLVVAAIGVASYYYFEYFEDHLDSGCSNKTLERFETRVTGYCTDQTSHYSAVTLLCMSLGYLIADSFTDTFEMTGDTMLICWLEDIKHNAPNLTGPESVRKDYLKHANKNQWKEKK